MLQPDSSRLARRNVLTSALVEALRVDDVRDAVGRAIDELLGADRAILLRPKDGRLVGHLAIGLWQEQAEEVAVLHLELPINAAGDRMPVPGSMGLGGSSIPVLYCPVGPRADGWVMTLCYPDTVPSGDTHVELAVALCTAAWLALRRVELVAELEAKVEILEARAAVSSSAGLDLDELLPAVCHRAAAALSCERAAIYLYDAEDELVLAHLWGSELGDGSSDGSATAAWLLRGEESTVVQRPDDCPVLDGPWRVERGVVSLLGQPLRVSDRYLGVIVVAHTDRKPRGFTNLCRLVADALGQEASLAIENARLFTSERDALRRLSELDQLKADYIAGITHDLKSPLTGLLGFVSTMRRLDELATPDERREYLDIMDRQAKRLAGLVEDLLVGARLEAGQLQPDESETVHLGELVRDVLTAIAPDRRARVLLTQDGDVRVCADRLQLERVVQNLVDNALHHGPEPSAVEVTVARDGDHVTLSVRDHGGGISEGGRERLFTRYGRGEPRRGSTGLGLWIVRGIVEGHGGTVEVDSTPGKGATFLARLPATGPGC